VFINHHINYDYVQELKSQLNVRKIDPAYFVERTMNRGVSKNQVYDLINNLDIESLVSLAGTIRSRYKQGPITYSRKVFINLINLCRDSCSYCTYKKHPSQDGLSMLGPDQVLAIAEAGRRFRCTEALIVTGESPEQKYPEARAWLKIHGCKSTIEYVDKVSSMILRKTGLLPHTNAGILSKDELSILRETNVSLGCMLESSSERLIARGMAHEFAPSKNPKARIRTLENGGELRIPMTTGLLLGIGETFDEVIDALFVLKEVNEKHGNIQEIIMQNFVPKYNTLMRHMRGPPLDYFTKAVALARVIMPDMNIQVPPNLSPNCYSKFIDCGINDWGGISPVTIDHVNPESPWPKIQEIVAVTQQSGRALRARLPIYPEFINQKRGFIHGNLINHIHFLSGPDGLVREDYLN
jgi:7,8-didemethyl-8-hydroxy-5-deazariboflavin synthase